MASGSVSVDSGLDIANSQPVSSSPSNAPSKGIWKRLTGGHQKRELEDFSESDDAVLVRHREKDAGEESKTLGEKVKKEVEGKSSKAGLAKVQSLVVTLETLESSSINNYFCLLASSSISRKRKL